MNASGSATAVISDRLDEAETALRRERRRTIDELEALRALEDRVRSIEPTNASGSGVRNRRLIDPRTARGATAVAAGLDRVRKAYESTVMSVPHYAEEYGDTYRRSLEEEFSPDLAAALTEGARFHDQCKRALLSAIEESVSARESLSTEVDAERESLDDATSALSAIATELDELSEIPFRTESFGALDAYRNRLDALEERCETISNRRQATVFDRRRTGWLPADVTDIATYFYRDLETDYPVMSAVATLLERLRGLRLRIERAMTFCHA